MRSVKIFGPPGTGKTTALLRILEEELDSGVPPNRVAFLTFTVQARQVAVERVQGQFGYQKEDLPYFRTLHSLAYHQLNMERTSLVRESVDLEEFARESGYPFSRWSSESSSMLTPIPQKKLGDKLLAWDNFRRHNLESPDRAAIHWPKDPHLNSTVFRAFTRDYTAWKRREGVLDFTDLLEAELDPLPVDVVIVDEAQDLSKLQWRALRRFAANADRIYLAGDDDQAIFSWAGASPEAFLAWEADEVRILDQSYRLPQAVHRYAEGLVHQIRHRQEKNWRPREEEGRVTRVADPRRIIPLVDQGDDSWLLLYRNHYLGNPLEKELRALGIPYSRFDKGPPGTEWGEAIVYWERLRKGRPVSKRAAGKVLQALGSPRLANFQRSVSRDAVLTMEDLQGTWGVEDTRPWYQALRRIPARDRQYLRAIIRRNGSQALLEEPKVRLSTIHAAKGGEADHVLLLTKMSRQVRRTLRESPDEEFRVFYVGATRARKTLTVAGPTTQVLP